MTPLFILNNILYKNYIYSIWKNENIKKIIHGNLKLGCNLWL